jgi:hypothetical protein
MVKQEHLGSKPITHKVAGHLLFACSIATFGNGSIADTHGRIYPELDAKSR